MALDYRTIRYLESVGNSVHLHYVDGKTVIAVPDGHGRWLPQAASAGGDPGTYDPYEPPGEPIEPGDWMADWAAGFTLTSGFGYRSGGFHYGIDISSTTAAVGLPVKAVTQMVVTAAYDAYEGGNSTAGTYVKGNNGIYTFTYNHGADETLAVAVGDTVEGGQTLFMEGATGNVTGTHLHFEIIQGVYPNPWAPPYNNGAQFIDPIPVLRANGVNI